MDVEKLIRTPVAGLKPIDYPGPNPAYLRMDANTNLVGRNPAVDRVARRAAQFDLNQYPSCLSDDLREALAREHGLSPDEVLVGSGSDEMLDVLCKAFLNPGDTVAYPAPSFVMYSFFGRLHLARTMEVSLAGPDFALDVDALLRARAKITFIASPNNPTGNAFPREDLERLIRGAAGIVLVDEAYADFCGQEFASRVREFPNLAVSRTFSKSHALAGLRVGYGVACRSLMRRLYCAKTPLTVSALSEAIALEALADKSFRDHTVALIRQERARLAQAVAFLGFRAYRTDANFMLIDLGVPSRPALDFLKGKWILAREMGDFPGLDTCLRVTVGRPEHNDLLVSSLGDWKAACA